MTSAPRVRRALVIGGGDGGHRPRGPEASRRSSGCVMVEIDARVVEGVQGPPAHHRHRLGRSAAGASHRRRHRVREGGRHRAVRRDLPRRKRSHRSEHRAVRRGRFYRGCARVLAPNGIFTLQSESPFLMRDIFLQIQETLRRVFARVDPYFGPGSDLRLRAYGRGPARRWGRTRRRSWIPAPSASRHSRAYYNRDIHRGAFAVPNDLRRRVGGIEQRGQVP